MSKTITRPKSLPISTWLISPVAKYFWQCTEETQRAIKNLSLSLTFTVSVCGSILAASICHFGFRGDFSWFIPIFLLCAIFYLLLDRPIVFSDLRSRYTIRIVRIAIAIVLGLFNSFLLDSFWFAEDIKSAREVDIKTEEKHMRADMVIQDAVLNLGRKDLMNEIDGLNLVLRVKRDSLNAEADGTGGSGKKGIKQVWWKKYKMYQSDSVAVSSQIAMKNIEIRKVDSLQRANGSLLQAQIADLPIQFSTGINQSMKALHKLVLREGDFTNIFMSILILLVAMFFELIPLISKGYYDVSEYFDKCALQKDVKEKEASMVKNKEINLIGRKVVMDFKAEEIRLSREYHENNLDYTVAYNKMIHEKVTDELDRLQSLDEKMKQKYPGYFEKHLKPVLEQAYINIHNAARAAIAQVF